jgi:tRNA-Thr(GGU) m(6)t(6)A37 methyltransferase TsaA
MEFQTIGSVKSPVKEPLDENWGEIISEIHVAPSMAQGLQGLERFSHILVVFHMHKATHDPKTDLVRHPRGRADMPKVGIFAQRARHRPNPIGITAVKLLNIQGNTLTVQGLDAMDGSPVLDIKPYVPEFDRIDEPRVPEWMKRLLEGYF